jgi:hypothetical protein
MALTHLPNCRDPQSFPRREPLMKIEAKRLTRRRFGKARTIYKRFGDSTMNPIGVPSSFLSLLSHDYDLQRRQHFKFKSALRLYWFGTSLDTNRTPSICQVVFLNNDIPFV